MIHITNTPDEFWQFGDIDFWLVALDTQVTICQPEAFLF